MRSLRHASQPRARRAAHARPPVLGGAATLREAVRRFERHCVLATLAYTGHDKRETARLLGMSLASLYRKLGPGRRAAGRRSRAAITRR